MEEICQSQREQIVVGNRNLELRSSAWYTLGRFNTQMVLKNKDRSDLRKSNYPNKDQGYYNNLTLHPAPPPLPKIFSGLTYDLRM